jgi:hypothetical protein
VLQEHISCTLRRVDPDAICPKIGVSRDDQSDMDRTVCDDCAGGGRNMKLDKSKWHMSIMEQKNKFGERERVTSSATYLRTAVKGAASGTFTLRVKCVQLMQFCLEEANNTHTRNGSLGSEVSVILNATLPAFFDSAILEKKLNLPEAVRFFSRV